MLNLSEVIIKEYTFIDKLQKQPPIIPLLLIPLAFSNNKKLHGAIGIFCVAIFFIQLIQN